MADSWNAISCDPTAGSSSNHPRGTRVEGLPWRPLLCYITWNWRKMETHSEWRFQACALSLPEGVIAVRWEVWGLLRTKDTERDRINRVKSKSSSAVIKLAYSKPIWLSITKTHTWKIEFEGIVQLQMNDTEVGRKTNIWVNNDWRFLPFLGMGINNVCF